MKPELRINKKLLLPIVGLCVVALASCNDSGETSVSKPVEKSVIRVKAITIEPQLFRQKLTLTGLAKASKEVVIASEVAGRVVKVNFEKGADVAAGYALASLDGALLEAERIQAKAEVDIAGLDYRKLKALKAKRANVSETKLEQARLRWTAAKARALGLETRHNKLTIRAPFAGRLVGKNIEVGAFVGPGALLTRLMALQPIKVTVGIPETSIAHFQPGKKATVYFDAYPDEKFESVVKYISAEVDKQSRTFELDIEIANKNFKIAPEMNAKVMFIKTEIENSIFIPQTAVVELRDGHAVFIVEQGVAHERKVTLGDNSEDGVLVTSGLAAGETLVVKGQRGLMDQDKVEVVE